MSSHYLSCSYRLHNLCSLLTAFWSNSNLETSSKTAQRTPPLLKFCRLPTSMQSKISAFFKPSAPPQSQLEETAAVSETTEPEIRITYKRRTSKQPDSNNSTDKDSADFTERTVGFESVDAPVKPVSTSGKNLRKKRNYAQFHLELGQSDFYLHTCSVCGLKFACGDEVDEKVHKEFHKNYTHGVPFKGWRHERVISVDSSEGTRIILVLDTDPSAQRNKVQEVGKMMEAELGLTDGWLLHKLCKVHLFVAAQRIAGCLVTEPIKSAYKVLSSSTVQNNPNSTNSTADRSHSTVLQFGTVTFQREVIKRASSVNTTDVLEKDFDGAVFCEEEAVSAMCGIRAIWVAPFHRRKHVATKLLDAARVSFQKGCVVEHSQLAFSQPTSAGKALASRYCGTRSFLVYHHGLNC